MSLERATICPLLNKTEQCTPPVCFHTADSILDESVVARVELELAPDRTLTDDEVARQHGRIQRALETELEAQLRA